MANYNLSTRAQYDVVGIYKYGIKYFGRLQAASYLLELENFLIELSQRPELAKDASSISNALEFYNFKAHVIFYEFDAENEIYVVRVLGKRMNFVEHL
ncbi:type II toxin-antitoxin system RelE/ParE family toxin [Muricauda sp. SCSIO 64092]|uniref:type II toxin-antitoxin system RelE/ParE family toxin n=1 Tax=Allomuricauda sp. SCSIO 64092 TaxID=2908842 RepID=UPI001FF67285|nr:type II toxin-antitoxin system RelE/ParE family toxin [Muricauda sp. SCSIO 64092]UOY06526.1 type II toxin-antitoxin system RelE/ParE family toxin [Muricauda sp. SCSIO 64092]